MQKINKLGIGVVLVQCLSAASAMEKHSSNQPTSGSQTVMLSCPNWPQADEVRKSDTTGKQQFQWTSPTGITWDVTHLSTPPELNSAVVRFHTAKIVGNPPVLACYYTVEFGRGRPSKDTSTMTMKRPISEPINVNTCSVSDAHKGSNIVSYQGRLWGETEKGTMFQNKKFHEGLPIDFAIICDKLPTKDVSGVKK